jgi:eukaryotic-like serine/threonine-protein kinase
MPITLREQSFQVLAALMERPGEIVTREELRRRLWASDTFVDFEVALNSAVSRLRYALGDSANSPSSIETIPKRLSLCRSDSQAPCRGCDALREPNRKRQG